MGSTLNEPRVLDTADREKYVAEGGTFRVVRFITTTGIYVTGDVVGLTPVEAERQCFLGNAGPFPPGSWEPNPAAGEAAHAAVMKGAHGTQR